jgi:hypothetical protein
MFKVKSPGMLKDSLSGGSLDGPEAASVPPMSVLRARSQSSHLDLRSSLG